MTIEPSASTTFRELTAEIIRFRDDRDWAQFHTPKNLSAAIAIEAAELQETLLWRTDDEVEHIVKSASTDLRREVADVLVYALILCFTIGADPVTVVRDKLQENRAKYPIELAKGKATKYTQLLGAIKG